MRPIAPFLEHPEVTEIAIVRPGGLYTMERFGWRHHACEQLTFEHLSHLADSVAVYNGFGPGQGILSVTFPGGERGQIVRPPACVPGTLSLNIRKHTRLVKTLDELTKEGAFEHWDDVSGRAAPAEDRGYEKLQAEDEELLALKAQRDIPGFLEAAVRHKRNIVVSGATGAGKTTFARSIIELVPQDTRIVTIEDNNELLLPNHPNRVHMLYAKNPGPGDVSASMCVESSMRMTPGRIFLAELRGDETWEYLQALNTGHPGSVTTTHANSARDTFNRLAFLIKSTSAGGQIDLPMILTYLHSTVHIVLAFERYKLKELYFDPVYAQSRLAL